MKSFWKTLLFIASIVIVIIVGRKVYDCYKKSVGNSEPPMGI
ncbi:MAG: hypothetical protein PHF86_15240 [Candidatus Nanoarchaeia archaeon]|jgi:hypothetical protein|nr:hypothetical protein [Candidatus Nanoarchaeia archaeon]